MYLILMFVHSWWRWAVLILGFAAVFHAAVASFRGKPSVAFGNTLHTLFSRALDLQVVFGAALYLLFSPLTTTIPRAGIIVEAGSDPDFFQRYHPIGMLLAFVAVHLSSRIRERVTDPKPRALRTLIGDGLTVAILLLAIPWARPLFRF